MYSKKIVTFALALLAVIPKPLLAGSLSPTTNPDVTPQGTMVYWCCTDFGKTWTRIELLGRRVLSLRRYDTVVLEERQEEPLREEPIIAVKEPKRTRPSVYSARIGGCYHLRSNCPAGKRIREENKLYFLTPEMAQRAGRFCCHTCQTLKKEINRSVRPRQDRVEQPSVQERLQPNN